MFWCRFSVIAGGPVLIGLLFMLGWQHDLFQKTGWFDVVMHLLGGGFLTLTFAGIASRCRLKFRSLKPTLFAGVLFAAVAWEIFEVYFGLVPNWTQSVGDTVADVLCALAGSLAMLGFIRNS